MKLTIITPSYNHAQYIEDTIQSVENQKDCDIEHIVIDGGSKDGTIEILKKYPKVKWVSEKDNGQTHAINKGFAMATGEILAWLNSDDYYYQDALCLVASYFKENPDCHFIYGNITFVDENKKELITFTDAVMGYTELLANPDVVRQPSCFWRKQILVDIGCLNEELNLAMDFEFFLRIAKKFKMHYLNVNVSHFRFYVESKSNKYVSKQLMEIKKIFLAQSPNGGRYYWSFWRKRKKQEIKTLLRSILKKFSSISGS